MVLKSTRCDVRPPGATSWCASCDSIQIQSPSSVALPLGAQLCAEHAHTLDQAGAGTVKAQLAPVERATGDSTAWPQWLLLLDGGTEIVRRASPPPEQQRHADGGRHAHQPGPSRAAAPAGEEYVPADARPLPHRRAPRWPRGGRRAEGGARRAARARRPAGRDARFPARWRTEGGARGQHEGGGRRRACGGPDTGHTRAPGARAIEHRLHGRHGGRTGRAPLGHAARCCARESWWHRGRPSREAHPPAARAARRVYGRQAQARQLEMSARCTPRQRAGSVQRRCVSEIGS